jgi:primosomal protein N'
VSKDKVLWGPGETVSVFVDRSGRVGELSYLVGDGMELFIGADVEVPFGSRTGTGVVTGSGDPTKATRNVSRLLGVRSGGDEVAVARTLAQRHFSNFIAIAPRLSPAHNEDAEGVDGGVVALIQGDGFAELGRDPGDDSIKRRLALCEPLVDWVRLAALEAAAMSVRGQVLVLCPTKKMVEEVLGQFTSGAARLDEVPGPADDSPWRGFVEGTLSVGVATRSSALWRANNLAGIVVVAEGHRGHIESRQPYTNARDVAGERARVNGCELVLIGSNASAGGLGQAGKVRVVGSRKHWPACVLVERDRKSRYDLELSEVVIEALSRWRGKGVSPLVVVKGDSARRQCRECRSGIVCSVCGDYECAHPGSQKCSKCGSLRSVVFGWDQRRAARAVGSRCRVISADKLVREHDAGLVVVVDGDQFLGGNEVVAGRRAADLVLDAARAAGAGGELIVVATAGAEVYADLVSRRDLVGWARRVWGSMKEMGLPPFGRLVRLRIAAAHAPRLTGWPGRVFGPRFLSDSEYEVIVQCSDSDMVVLGACIDRLRKRLKVRVSVS